jgi:hypothetical protein
MPYQVVLPERYYMPRTTIEFSRPADDQLEQMTAKVGASSKAEVIRNALSLYAFVINELHDIPNHDLAIADNVTNKVVKVVIVPGLHRPLPSQAKVVMAQ